MFAGILVFMRCVSLGVLLVALCAGSVDAAADALSFETALALSDAYAPSVTAQSDAVAAAQSSAVAAGRLPDPRLFVGIENLPVSGPPAWTLDEEPMTMGRVGIIQEVPNPARRRAQRELAQAGIARAEAGLAIERARARREIAAAWITRYYLERRVALLDELDNENRLLAEGVNAQLAAGTALPADAVMPRQEAAMLAQRGDELAAEIARATAALRRWIGEAADRPLAGAPPAVAIDDRHLRHHLENHPEIAAFTSMQDMAEAEAHEAVAMKSPDWGVEVAYGRRDPDYGDMVSLQISIDLPFFTDKRQNPIIAARRTATQRIEAEREVMLREHSEELETQLAEHTRLAQALTRQEGSFIPLAREKLDLDMAAYGAGNVGLDVVLASRRALVEARLKAIELRSALAQLRARLHYGYAEDEA